MPQPENILSLCCGSGNFMLFPLTQDVCIPLEGKIQEALGIKTIVWIAS